MSNRFWQTNLDNGPAQITLPEKMSKDDVVYLNEYFKLIIQQLTRRAEEASNVG